MMTIAEDSPEAACASARQLVDKLVDAEKQGRLGLFARQPFAYLRQIGISDDSIVASLQFYGPETVVRSADAACGAVMMKKADDPRQAFSYLLEALDLQRGTGKTVPVSSGVDAVMECVDQLYSYCFRV